MLYCIHGFWLFKSNRSKVIGISNLLAYKHVLNLNDNFIIYILSNIVHQRYEETQKCDDILDQTLNWMIWILDEKALRVKLQEFVGDYHIWKKSQVGILQWAKPVGFLRTYLMMCQRENIKWEDMAIIAQRKKKHEHNFLCNFGIRINLRTY